MHTCQAALYNYRWPKKILLANAFGDFNWLFGNIFYVSNKSSDLLKPVQSDCGIKDQTDCDANIPTLKS